MSWRDIKRDMRRDVHSNMQIPALYLEAGKPPLEVTVRLHTKFADLGDMRGTSSAFAEKHEVSPKAILLTEEVPNPVRNAIISVAPGEAYRIDNAYPPENITITVEILRLSKDEAAVLPVPM